MQPLVLVGMSLDPAAAAAVAAFARTRELPDAAAARRDALAEADGVLAYGPPAVAELAGAPRLRAIAVHVAPAEVKEFAATHGIAVAEAAGLWDTVADHTVALLLAAVRRIPSADAAVRAGRWTAEDLKPLFSGRDLRGLRVGIVGAGRIGSAVAVRLGAFGVALAYADPLPNAALDRAGAAHVPLDELLTGSEAVVVTAPLTDATRGLIDARRLKLLRDDAILVNTARGALIDEDALVAELATGRFAAVALDVLRDEPAAASHPLLRFDRVTITPHLGGSTQDGDLALVEFLHGALATG